jgi:hypothetical protein
MGPGYRRHGQIILLERTELEMGNIRAAFEWAMQSGQVESAARLISPLGYFLHYRDHFVEGYRWTERLLERAEEISPEYLVNFFPTACRLAYINGLVSESKSLAQQGLGLSRQIRDRSNEAWSLALFGLGFINPSSPEKNREGVGYCEEALAIFRELGEKPGIAQAVNNIGLLARMAGDNDRAWVAFEECLAVTEDTGEIYRQVLSLSNLAMVAYEQGEAERMELLARQYLKQTLDLGGSLKLMGGLGLAMLAGSRSLLGDPVGATQLMSASNRLLAEIGGDLDPADRPIIAKITADVKPKLGDKSFQAAWDEGQSMTFDEAVEYALKE